MTATLELRTDAFNAEIAGRGWTILEAAQRMGVARSTVYRLRKRELAPSAELVAAILLALAKPRQVPERLFERLFTITDTTKET